MCIVQSDSNRLIKHKDHKDNQCYAQVMTQKRHVILIRKSPGNDNLKQTGMRL